jgi:hypothetical protein
MAWAALTAGLPETTLGRLDAAREYLTEAMELGGLVRQPMARGRVHERSSPRLL